MELLEREAYLAGLEEALADARAGRGRVILIYGEAGIGKTALLRAFAARQPGSLPILWGGCDPLSIPLPFGPLNDMASQLSPSLAGLLHSQAPRSAIFPAVLSELESGTRMLIFEDLHWADESTLDLLQYLSRRINLTRSLLVLTYRQDEINLQHPLRRVLGELPASEAVRRFALPPLSTAAVSRLVGRRKLDPDALFRQTGGNPFFVTEVLANPADGLPPTIREAVLARAARLSGDGFAALQAAAVIGPRIETWLLAQVTQADPEGIDECLEAGMLVKQAEELAFRHELARQALLETIPPYKQQILHRLTLAGLKDAGGTRQNLARLALHAEAAGEPQSVLDYAPAAAQEASAASAHREAASLYHLALKHAELLPPAEHAILLEAYAEETNAFDQRLDSIAAYQQALEIWRSLGDASRQGSLLASLTSMMTARGQDAAAESYARQAIAILEGIPPSPALADAYRKKAFIELGNRNFDQALGWIEKSAALVESQGSKKDAFRAQLLSGIVWLHRDYPRGCQIMEQAARNARATGQISSVAVIYANLGAVSCELFQLAQAERYLQMGLEAIAQNDMDRLRYFISAHQAQTFLYQGRWEIAAEPAEWVLKHATRSVNSRMVALTALGRLRARRGEPQVNELLDEAAALTEKMLGIDHLGLVFSARAEAAWLAGDPERAGREAATVYELAIEQRHPWFAGELGCWRLQAGESLSLPDWAALPYRLQAAGKWEAAAAEWKRLGCPYEQARALADGPTKAQVAALRIFERLGARPAAEQLRQRLHSAGAINLPRKPRQATRNNPFGLTNRQTEILGLLTEGLSNAEIAARLHLSIKTVDHHVSAILSHLQVHSRRAAAALAREHASFQ